MTTPPPLTDTAALARNRARAARLGDKAAPSAADAATDADFLTREAIDDIKERLNLVNRRFTTPAIVTARPEAWGRVFPDARIVPDAEILDLTPGAHDLVIHALTLHWANDPVGQLVQARHALKPDGLFLGVLMGGQTLNELRSALAQAESELTGGLSARVLPMGEIRDLGALLQRAGFALPVADSHTLTARYPTALHLMHDLRAMGEANAMAGRNRAPLRRDVLQRAIDIYRTHFADGDGVRATYEMISLTGWAPSPDQPQPLRPGSASARLAEALGTDEHPLGDPAKP